MPEETRHEIKTQFENAMLSGATEKIKTSMSNTGIRDTISLGILNATIELGKRLRKHERGTTAMPENEVRARLANELETLLQGKTLDESINPLLGMPGELWILQASIY